MSVFRFKKRRIIAIGVLRSFKIKFRNFKKVHHIIIKKYVQIIYFFFISLFFFGGGGRERGDVLQG